MRHADADAVCGADTEAANLIGPCSDSKRIRTRIGQEIPRSDVITDVFSQLSKRKGISEKVVVFRLKHAVAELLPTVKVDAIVEDEILLILL